MRIGEVAERLAVNPRTIRYYESIGLIPEPARTESDYRDYDEKDFERIRFIKTARRLDLALDEIREILAFADKSQVPCGHVRRSSVARPGNSMIESPIWHDSATSCSKSNGPCLPRSEIMTRFVR